MSRHANNDIDECLICHAPLSYSEEMRRMECAICHRDFQSNACCINGHFVCDECHSKGLDSIVGICRNEHSKDPIEVMNHLMSQPFCHMHGPEHHTMVGAALLCAYHNCGGELNLDEALDKMLQRGRQVPGGICGFWGCCGAAVGCGIYMSIVTGSTPMATKNFGLSNLVTSEALHDIGQIGGPRCCKRDSYLALLAAARFTKEHLGIDMPVSTPSCTYVEKNRQCIRIRCPFFPATATLNMPEQQAK